MSVGNALGDRSAWRRVNYGVKTHHQADGAVRRASVILGCKSRCFQYNWGVACAVIQVKPGDHSVFLVTLIQEKWT